jgi:hypothetical protein
LNIVKAATKEMMIISHTFNAFTRQEQIGAIQLLKEAAKERNMLESWSMVRETNDIHIQMKIFSTKS